MSSQYLNATRMELAKLKKQLEVTIRGHKLLKDKQDELMRNFNLKIDEFKKENTLVRNELSGVFKMYLKALVEHTDDEVEDKLKVAAKDVKLKISQTTIMSTPQLDINLVDTPFNANYSNFNTTPAFQLSLLSLNGLLPKIIYLAQLNKNIELLITEIEKVKRRVNAIEHIMIPELESDVKVIQTKLSEQELSNTVRVMKSKEMVINKIYKQRNK